MQNEYQQLTEEYIAAIDRVDAPVQAYHDAIEHAIDLLSSMRDAAISDLKKQEG